MRKYRRTVNDCPLYTITLQVADVKIEIAEATVGGIRDEALSEGEEGDDAAHVEPHGCGVDGV